MEGLCPSKTDYVERALHDMAVLVTHLSHGHFTLPLTQPEPVAVNDKLLVISAVWLWSGVLHLYILQGELRGERECKHTRSTSCLVELLHILTFFSKCSTQLLI